MTNWPAFTRRTPGFTRAEWDALNLLRRRYLETRDLFTPHELARLRFITWLHQTRRLELQPATVTTYPGETA